MFNKRRDELSNGTSSDIFGTKRNRSGKVLATIVINNSVDEGVCAFGLWLNAENKKSLSIPIIMKEFAEGRKALLQDNLLQKEIIVNIVEGIPFCNECKLNDCAHVGFTICAEQMNLRSKLE
ncbi:MAG: hypothetical protein M3264_08910 [Thermoproteota archaeon]|nr:hypothetical protein [Thermoproteota archaeon]